MYIRMLKQVIIGMEKFLLNVSYVDGLCIVSVTLSLIMTEFG